MDSAAMCPARMANSAAEPLMAWARWTEGIGKEPSGSSPTGAGHLAREDRKPPAENRRESVIGGASPGAPGFTGGTPRGTCLDIRPLMAPELGPATPASGGAAVRHAPARESDG